MARFLAERMSSSDRRKIRRNLERGSTQAHSSTGFPGVNCEGYLVTETSRLLSSPRDAQEPSPRDRKSRKAERIFYGSEHTEGIVHKPRRRASVEKKIRQDAYHSLLEGGHPFSDEEEMDDADNYVQGHVQSHPFKEKPFHTQQLQLAVPNALVETPRPSMVSVLCGRQDPKSWYLTRRLIRMPGNDGNNLVPLKHSNIDPDAAELHRLWRHTGIIPTRYRDINFDPDGIDPQPTWIVCWPLMNAAIYGHMLEDNEFIDRVMDLLEEKIVKGIRPDVDTISHIFGEKRHHVPMVLQRFLVDRWVDLSTRGFGDVDLHSLPGFFVYAALDTATRRLSSASEPSSLPGCRYHTHSKSGMCYWSRNTQFKASRQERHKHRREKASREAEQVAADSLEYGIATVDWEERRAEAHRALHDQVDEYSPTTRSWRETPGQEIYGMSMERLESPDHNLASDRETDPENHVHVGSSSSSVCRAAQVDGAVDEVKFAPPTRESPPPPPTSTPTNHRDSDVGNNQGFKELPTYEKVTLLCGDVMPVVKSEERSGPTPSDAPVIPPHSNACARAISEEIPRLRERTTCPGSFPGSKSGSVKSVVPA